MRGVLPDRAVTVVQVEWHGTQALTLTYRDDAGKVDHELLYRANEARLEIEGAGPAWNEGKTCMEVASLHVQAVLPGVDVP